LLDEPVNHVVLGPVRELKKSPGGAAVVLLVSHDRLRGAVSPAAYSGRGPDSCSNELEPI
jgi:hypothetical protein